MLINGSRGRFATFAIAVLALTACSKKESSSTDTTAASSTVSADTSAMSAAPTAGTWTDANIFALLGLRPVLGRDFQAADERAGATERSGATGHIPRAASASLGASAAGAVAATKGTAAAVRDFGKRMMRDHHQLRTQGEALAKKLKVTPAAPSDDPLAPAAQKEMDTLNSTAKGKDFDRAYIDAEVDAHKAVLDVATKAAAQTQTAELKNLIQKAAPVVQGHLDRAEAIQKTLK